MLSAKTFLSMEEKILPRIWEEKYPPHPWGSDTSYLQGWSPPRRCRNLQREEDWLMKTKSLFKASLNLVPLFYPGTAALSEGRGVSLEILKLPTEKNITGKVQICLSCRTS